MTSMDALKIKIFADSADKNTILNLQHNKLIQGFTTNPTLMLKAGIKDYKGFAEEILSLIGERPISFEVFSDDFSEMYDQALLIASWGKNVYVKIPVTNTQGQSSLNLIQKLAHAGVKQNITALMTLEQVETVTQALAQGPTAFISIFAGRIADTGRDPVPLMQTAVNMLQPYPKLQLIWASTRELFNIFQANAIGCHVITVSTEIMQRTHLVGRDLQQFSVETIKSFYDDAQKLKLSLA
jgi:transaldolase